MSTVLCIVLIGVRITTMLVVAPILGHRSVPWFAKLLLALVVTLAISPLAIQQSGTGASSPAVTPETFISTAMSEALIGGLLGLGTLIIFCSAQMIGVAIGQISGLQLDAATQADSSTGQLPVERLIGMVAVATFVLASGPELMMGALLETFETLPLGSGIARNTVLDLVTTLLARSFELTVLAIAPAVASLLISTILIGILARTLPQLNLIQVGLSSNVAMMLLALALTLGGSIWITMDNLQPTLAQITDNLNLWTHGK